MKALPLARKASLVVKDVDDETLVYDLETDQAHCLNDTAARVWKSCDGQTSVTEIALNLRAHEDAPVEENVVWLALDQLEKFKLLEKPLNKPATFLPGMSRRQAVRALGVAAISLPLITSIVAPTGALAQSVLQCFCANPKECQDLFGPNTCCFPHDTICNGAPSTKACITNPSPPCKT